MLLDFTKTMIEENFYEINQKQKYELMVSTEAKKILDQHKGFDQTSFTVIKIKIDNALQPKIKDVKFKLEDQFNKFVDEKGIRPQIKTKRMDYLET